MCEPTIALGILSVAGAAVGTMSRVRQSNAEYDYMVQQDQFQYAREQQAADDRYRAEMAEYEQQRMQAELANRRTLAEAHARQNEAIFQYQQLGIQQQEANENAADEKTQTARKAAEARALAMVNAGESGIAISSNSVQRMLQDIGMDKAYEMATIESNRESKVVQAQSEKQGASLSARVQPSFTHVGQAPTRDTVLAPPSRTAPSHGLTIASGIINGATGAFNAYDRYSAYKNRGYSTRSTG